MEQRLPPEIPPSAKLVRACGDIVTVSLVEEYDAPPERRAAFVEELRALDEAVRQSTIGDRNIRL